MNLQTIASIAEIFGFVAVMAAIIFGWIQIQQFKRQRRDQAAIELVRNFQDIEFTRGFRLIHSLPEDISADEFKSKGTEYIDAAYSLSMKYETMGVLVHREVVPIDAVEDLIGGVGITLWKRLSPWIHAVRKEQSNEHILEWYQWLIERILERGNKNQEPAYKRFRIW
ncbi:MAG: DUF4760 domain-containing protein [Candidatus Marinimicrobia bacterium]|nr:DUF4760 domain-containing protein [Candidatus Neomarinimicrobiota bacterium]MCF7850282.1 DUF4760 domain-containing protein [Candidatus Neomarinimicrobiota bacterium]MCF7903821.1 DUF4760 domain-containing protein [Candidatus Neomarinimicrobiota bacterium]